MATKTQCYAMVRGSALRVTGLSSNGGVPSPVTYCVSRSAVKVTINEVTDGGTNELVRNDLDQPRINLKQNQQTIRYTCDMEFLRVDPGLLNLITSVPVVANAAGVLVGFDANTRLPVSSFALEVWTKIAAAQCVGGVQQYGYTLFPYMRGGIVTGFAFQNGLVSFNVRGSMTRRGAKWGFGPHDLEGVNQRLYSAVSRNVSWRSFLSVAQPPAQTDGVLTLLDVIDGGTASVTTADILDGGTAPTAGTPIADGGSAA